jgi:hypothetical protein
MDIEAIYRQALSAGNHGSALQAVFDAGRFHVEQSKPEPVFVDGPTGVEYSIKDHSHIDIDPIKADDDPK